MAGTNRGFNPNTFRDAIRFVYEMAAPPDPDRQVTFHFETSTTWSDVTDSDNVPFDPTARQTASKVKSPIKVPCNVEAGASTPDDDTPFGTVIASQLRITLLDEDYLQVSDATFVVLDGDKYLRQQIKTPYGLFDVGLHQMVFVAENDL